MIPENSNQIQALIPVIAKKLNRSEEEVVPFIKILNQNWYDSIDSLKNLKDSDYQKMKIPHRVATIIQEQIGITSQKDKIENPVQEPKKPQKKTLNEFEMQALCKQLWRKLNDPQNGKRQQTKEILQTLLKLIQNIIKDPYQMKFRKLKKSNKMIEKTIVQNQCVKDFVKAIGFQESSQFFQMFAPEVHHLLFLQDCLQFLLDNFKHREDNQSRFIDFSKISSMKNHQPINQQQQKHKIILKEGQQKQYFNEQRLSEMKYSDALDQLMKIRQELMSKPPKDRKIRIYHKRHENRKINFEQVTFESEFAKSEDQQIAKYWKQIVANNRKGQSFQSKRKIQFQQLIKQKIHKQSLIKIRLPNQFIIQARFGPLQRLQDVLDFVASIIIGDLYMFTTPPVKRMGPKQLKMTLFDLQAVPMGSFYLGSNTEWYIEKTYHPIIVK